MAVSSKVIGIIVGVLLALGIVVVAVLWATGVFSKDDDVPDTEAITEQEEDPKIVIKPPEKSFITPSDAASPSTIDSTVAISDDGVTLVVGNRTENSNEGGTWVFALDGIEWKQQGSKLVGTGATGSAQQGYQVAVSGDGKTLATAGPLDDSSTGAVWIFVNSGGTWTQQGSKLVGSDVTGAAFSGDGLFLSYDGNTLAVGGPNDNTGAGAAWIFTRSGTTWSQQGSKLVGAGAVGAAHQGIRTALSKDGNTLAVGGDQDDSNAGAVWVYTRSGSTWSPQGSKLVGSSAVGAARQGIAVALSSDGNTMAVGGRLDNGSVGAVWIFTRSGSTWSEQDKLTGTGGTTPQIGQAATISGDGNTVAAAGSSDTGGGATWIFMRSGSTWSQQGSKITENSADPRGEDLSMARDKKYLAVSSTGGVWIYTPPYPT